jgi:hypothetical protein
VVKSKVHFPTDYNLMWDCIRKCLDTIAKFMDKYPGEVEGWRKIHHWYRRMKNAMRAVGKATSSGGRNKEDRIEKAVCYYLSIARVLHDKLGKTELPISLIAGYCRERRSRTRKRSSPFSRNTPSGSPRGNCIPTWSWEKSWPLPQTSTT